MPPPISDRTHAARKARLAAAGLVEVTEPVPAARETEFRAIAEQMRVAHAQKSPLKASAE